VVNGRLKDRGATINRDEGAIARRSYPEYDSHENADHDYPVLVKALVHQWVCLLSPCHDYELTWQDCYLRRD
jgi:hypothetical protein